jgi:lipopolysaccharide transport system ATP-binding protein
MDSRKTAIKVENISKCYRIGLKENVQDTFAKSILKFIKSPLNNYRKYRSLYNFSDIKPDQGLKSNNDPSDIIWAIRDVSFEIKEGEIVGIIGVNGAGKSTLLKMLTRITLPTSGIAKIHGRVSSLLEVGTGFHPELTGKENVYLNGTILGMRKREIDLKYDEIVDFSGVKKFIDTPVKRYSSGMKVRLAFAVAAHLEPEILLIDEVLAVGDASFQKKCLDKMQDVSQHGRTVLFVSHNMQAITRLCSRTILLNGGRVQADGPSHKVVSAYMHSEKATKAEHKWSDMMKAPGDDVVRLCAVRVKTKEGNITEVMDIRKPIVIEMEYELLQPSHILMVYFSVVNEDGILVFTSIDNDPAWRDSPRPVGCYVSTACIPGNLLGEGILFVRASMRTLKPMIRRFRVEDVVAFQVVDSLEGDSARVDYGGELYGVMRPLLRWETQYSPKGNEDNVNQ